MTEESLRLAAAWFQLLAEAAAGTREAKETLRTMTERTPDPKVLVQQILSFLPAGAAAPSAETVSGWLEGVWSTTGVVPRARYVELLERHEALRARLEEAEVTIAKLRRLLAERGKESDAREMLDGLAGSVGETLQQHAEWMSNWISPAPSGSKKSKKKRA